MGEEDTLRLIACPVADRSLHPAGCGTTMPSTRSSVVCLRHVDVSVVAVILLVASVLGILEGGTADIVSPTAMQDGKMGGMWLRGGSAAVPRPVIKVLRSNSNSGIKQEGQPQSTSSRNPAPAPVQSAGSIFIKVTLPGKEAKNANKVQVVGSWSSFKERTEMKKLPSGDWESIIELPKGRHEYKYVLNDNNWICSNEVEITQDKNGNRNNVLLVEESRRGKEAAAKAAGGQAVGGNVEDDKVFVQDSSGIDAARDVFQRLLEEEGKASERLKRAQGQLVETLRLELQAGLETLAHCTSHVGGYTSRAEKGMADLRANAAGKRAEIKGHLDAIREVMASKEAGAVELVESTCKSRLERLDAQVAVCNNTLPELYQLMEKVKTELDNCPKNPSSFVDGSQALIPQMEVMSLRLMNTPGPVVVDDFVAPAVDVVKP